MSDWQPQVVRIEKVEKHPGADRLIIVTVMGDYPIITNMIDLKVGDLIGYLPIDTIVPDTDEFHFLSPVNRENYEEDGEVKSRILGPKYPVGSVPEKYRILKAKKIRGVYSQGMLQPINPCWDPNRIWVEGDSLVEVMNLKKWEEPEEEYFDKANCPKASGKNAEKAPSGWAIPYYDIDSVRKYVVCLQEGEEIVLTEKLHGSNGAFCHDGTRLWVKSRNYYKRMDPEDMWWDVAIRYELEKKLAQFPNMVFFGEVHGQVKGYRYDAQIVSGKLELKIRFFDILNTHNNRYLDYDDKVAMIKAAGLDPVPELYRGPWTTKEEMYKFAEGPSTLNPKHLREGWVLNTVKERFEPKLQSRMQVKLVGEGYNLAK
jgi:RNA ligase (TIGR02306 family)